MQYLNVDRFFCSCYAYRQETDEEVHDTTTYPDKDDFLMSCPRFANQGCFKAEYTTSPELSALGFNSSFNKGCSMYELGDRDTECDSMGLLGDTCRGKLQSLHCIGFQTILF